MTVEPNAMQRVLSLINSAADLVVLSILLVVLTIFILPGTQRSWAYAACGIGMGVAGGLAVRYFGLSEGWVIIGTLVGVITGPATVMKFQGKTADEVFRELRNARRSGGEGEQ